MLDETLPHNTKRNTLAHQFSFDMNKYDLVLPQHMSFEFNNASSIRSLTFIVIKYFRRCFDDDSINEKITVGVKRTF